MLTMLKPAYEANSSSSCDVIDNMVAMVMEFYTGPDNALIANYNTKQHGDLYSLYNALNLEYICLVC